MPPPPQCQYIIKPGSPRLGKSTPYLLNSQTAELRETLGVFFLMKAYMDSFFELIYSNVLNTNEPPRLGIC